MGPNLTIHRAPTDFKAWSTLLALLHDAFAFQHDRINPPSSLHRFDAQGLAAKARQEVLIIATLDDALVGCVFAKPEPQALYIGKFAVRPGLQGRGIGRQLLAAVEQLAAELHLPAIDLETRIELHENHASFAAMGFQKISEHAHAGFTRPTSIRMRKTLAPPPNPTP